MHISQERQRLFKLEPVPSTHDMGGRNMHQQRGRRGEDCLDCSHGRHVQSSKLCHPLLGQVDEERQQGQSW